MQEFMGRKRTTATFCIAVIALISGASASPSVTLLDGQHHVWVQAIEYDSTGPGSSWSLSHEEEASSAFADAGGLQDLWVSVSLPGQSSATSWTRPLSVGVVTFGTVPGQDPSEARGFGEGHAIAEGAWVFQPQWNTLRINVTQLVYGNGDAALVDLRDLTVGTQVYYYEDDNWPPFPPAGGELEFSLNTTHVYSLAMSVTTNSYRDGEFKATMEGCVVPVPGAAMLVMLGAGSVHWLARRRKL